MGTMVSPIGSNAFASFWVCGDSRPSDWIGRDTESQANGVLCMRVWLYNDSGSSDSRNSTLPTTIRGHAGGDMCGTTGRFGGRIDSRRYGVVCPTVEFQALGFSFDQGGTL